MKMTLVINMYGSHWKKKTTTINTAGKFSFRLNSAS